MNSTTTANTNPKTKASKAAARAAKVPNPAIHSRISYLYQAATYLASQKHEHDAPESRTANVLSAEIEGNEHVLADVAPFESSARRLVTELRNVSGKVVIRMSSNMKRSICRNCDAVLINGGTCEVELENKSKGGKKPWADVLVRKCKKCGYCKKYPLGERQKRRKHRPIRS